MVMCVCVLILYVISAQFKFVEIQIVWLMTIRVSQKISTFEISSSHLLKCFHMGSHCTTQSFSNFENVLGVPQRPRKLHRHVKIS